MLFVGGAPRLHRSAKPFAPVSAAAVTTIVAALATATPTKSMPRYTVQSAGSLEGGSSQTGATNAIGKVEVFPYPLSGTAQLVASGPAQNPHQNFCLGLDASANDHLQHAISDKRYATCLFELAKKQGMGCEPPTNDTPPSEPGWANCMARKGCDKNCQTRAGAFWLLAQRTTAYHTARALCEQNAANVSACHDADLLRRSALPGLAQQLTGAIPGKPFPSTFREKP